MKNPEELKNIESQFVSLLELGIKLTESGNKKNFDDKKYSYQEVFEFFRILFKNVIDDGTLNEGIINYRNVNTPGRIDDFLINFENFKKLIEENGSYKYCKFYFLEDYKNLNIGLAFSNHEEIEPDANDLLYILNHQKHDFVKDPAFLNKRDNFRTGIAQSMSTNYSITMTEVILYELDTVFLYNAFVCHSFNVTQLKFRMFKYPNNYPNDTIKQGRISFAVNPVIAGLNDSQTKSFDAGDLKP